MVSARRKPEKLDAAVCSRAQPAGSFVPVCCLPVTGALSCRVLVNGNRASAIIDTGSAISLIVEEFAKKCACEIEPWSSPVVRVVTGNEFIITRACFVEVTMLGRSMMRCISQFSNRFASWHGLPQDL